MSNRKDFYFKQPVTEGELDAAFDQLENADRAMAGDFGFLGVLAGAQVAQHSTPNLSVDVAGGGITYDQLGQRIYWPSVQTVDVSQDFNSVSTAVASAGNQKWVSVFAMFKRLLSDPRVDGNAQSVYFERDESFGFYVTQGAEAAIGVAARPTLQGDKILLADLDFRNGETTVLTASVHTDRRQDAVVVAGSPFSIRRGRFVDALADIVAQINGGASSLGYAGGANWADGSTNPATTVAAQLSKILTDLGGGTNGSAKISQQSFAGTRLTISAGTLQAVVAAIQGAIDALETTGADTVKTVSSIANLRLVVSANIPPSGVYVVKDFGLYHWDAASTATDNGVSVIKPTDEAGAGRFILSTAGEDNVLHAYSSGGYGATFYSNATTAYTAAMTATSAAGVPGAVVTATATIRAIVDASTTGSYILSFQEDSGSFTDIAASYRETTSSGAAVEFTLQGTYVCTGTPTALKAVVRAKAAGAGNAYVSYPSSVVMNVRKCTQETTIS